MLKPRLKTSILILIIIGTFLLASCGAGEPPMTPTLTVNPDEIRTQAVGTFAADLTLTALVAPSDTPAPTQTPAPTIPALATSTAGTPFGVATTAGGSTGTCYGLTFVSDVTIPDNTPMTPGRTFTKTWKVLNSGTCAWDAGFKFALIDGEAMGGSTLTLPASVAAGAQYDLSVPMTAPNTSGTVRGDWQMSTASGQFFGNVVYVQIVVSGSGAAATGTPTATATATSTP